MDLVLSTEDGLLKTEVAEASAPIFILNGCRYKSWFPINAYLTAGCCCYLLMWGSLKHEHRWSVTVASLALLIPVNTALHSKSNWLQIQEGQ